MKLANSVIVLVMALGFAACGPDGGQTQTGVGGSGGAGGAAGGASPDAGATTLATRLLGTWRYTAGQMTCGCDDGSNISETADGTATERFSAGPSASQVIATNDGGCALTCDVLEAQGTVVCQPATCELDGFRVTTSQDVYGAVGDRLNEVALFTVEIAGGPTCDCTQTDNVLVRAQ